MTMNFSLNEDQQSLRDLAHEFAKEVIRPVSAHHDETTEYPWEVIKQGQKI